MHPDFCRVCIWVCYQQPNILFGEGFRLESSCDVQQGDVCWPVFLAIALHKVVPRPQELDLNFQFWDLDGILCDSVEAVGTAVLLLKQELPPLQLDLDLQNCNVFLPNVHSVQHFGLEGIPPVDFFIRPNVSWSADRKRRPHLPPHQGGSQQTSDRLEEGNPSRQRGFVPGGVVSDSLLHFPFGDKVRQFNRSPLNVGLGNSLQRS